MKSKFCRNKLFSVGMIVFLMLLIVGCCGSNCPSDTSVGYTEPPAGPTLGTLITSPSFTPVTVISQFIPCTDTDGAVAPGMANIWDLASNFAMEDGGDDQFDAFLELIVGSAPFPSDQIQSELTYYTPVMGAADGAITVSVSSDTIKNYTTPISGTYSAYLYPTGNSIMQQTIDLTAATGTVTLSFSIMGASYGGAHNWGASSYFTGGPDTFRIVVRDTIGNELAGLYSVTNNLASGTHTANLTTYVGQTIVLSFEHKGQNSPIVIDDVTVTDGASTEFVTNGDFEAGSLAPWTANTAANVIQNITSGTRTLEGLDVTRSFYTVPNKLWGRWVDVFSNSTGSDITKTITYATNLGSDTYGIIYYTPGTSNKALTSWDGEAYDRDIGWVFGNATTVTFTSASALLTHDGSDNIYTTYDITVPAGGKVAIVNFLIMSGTDTGLTAADITAKATDIDTVGAAIVAHFRKDPQYRNGMTKAQINAIVNF